MPDLNSLGAKDAWEGENANCYGETLRLHAETFFVSCGAVNSAALLLRSASPNSPSGLANSPGLVGRNYMVHDNSFLMAIAPFRLNPTTARAGLPSA